MAGEVGNGEVMLRWAANTRGKPAVIAQRGEEILLTERVDLVDSRARERLARRLHQVCGLPPGEVQRALMGFSVEWLEWQQRSDAEQRTSPEQGEALRWEPSAEARRQAERLLEQPNLLGRVLDVAAELGVVNERALVATAFLVGTTRLCEKPGYLLIQGDPSTGKSFVASIVAKLFPPTVVEDFTDVSPMALYYVSTAGLSLKHKLVVLGERRRQTTDESIDCTRALRELHESGRLSKLVAAKKHRQPTAVRVTLEGAPAIIETVSHSAIPAEDLSRAIVCWTDETRSQTAAVNLDYARRKSGHSPSLDPAALEVVRACQWLLEPYEVRLPLEAVAKKFPTDTPESRRALRRLGVVAEASVLLHQRQRRATESALVGELDDLRLAWRLLRPWLRNRLVAGPPPSVERIWAAVREIDEQFTADDLDRQKLGSKATVWRALRHLEKAGAIRDTGERGPRQTRVYTVADPDWQPDDLPIELDELLGDETMKRSGCC